MLVDRLYNVRSFPLLPGKVTERCDDNGYGKEQVHGDHELVKEFEHAQAGEQGELAEVIHHRGDEHACNKNVPQVDQFIVIDTDEKGESGDETENQGGMMVWRSASVAFLEIGILNAIQEYVSFHGYPCPVTVNEGVPILQPGRINPGSIPLSPVGGDVGHL
jgi:hypothetical protein